MVSADQRRDMQRGGERSRVRVRIIGLDPVKCCLGHVLGQQVGSPQKPRSAPLRYVRILARKLMTQIKPDRFAVVSQATRLIRERLEELVVPLFVARQSPKL